VPAESPPGAHVASLVLRKWFLQAIRDGVPVVLIDNTCVNLWEYKQYEDMAEDAGYKVSPGVERFTC